ncbi:hypothetical protein [Anaeroarcus burkinensis]|uniref:hypothetical protein n=1 Tax=Anaeroarcus burkinensis TaxID=82376 RepID=UPI001AEC678A|nr:hypothetical protein [Anaeroarcus burkinensis]
MNKWLGECSADHLSFSFKRLVQEMHLVLDEQFNANFSIYSDVFSMINMRSFTDNLEEQAFWNWMKKYGEYKLELILSKESIEKCFNTSNESVEGLIEYRLFLLESDKIGGYKVNLVDSLVDTIDALYDYVSQCRISQDVRSESRDAKSENESNVFNRCGMWDLGVSFDDNDEFEKKTLERGFSFFVSNFSMIVKIKNEGDCNWKHLKIIH